MSEAKTDDGDVKGFLDRYPQHKLVKENEAKKGFAGEFLDWLGRQGIELCRFDERREEYFPERVQKERLIAQFLGIDYDEFQAEKDRMLEALR